jgi:hypothetical protein
MINYARRQDFTESNCIKRYIIFCSATLRMVFYAFLIMLPATSEYPSQDVNKTRFSSCYGATFRSLYNGTSGINGLHLRFKSANNLLMQCVVTDKSSMPILSQSSSVQRVHLIPTYQADINFCGHRPPRGMTETKQVSTLSAHSSPTIFAGVVTDEDNLPIQGVSVTIFRSIRGNNSPVENEITARDGAFSFSVDTRYDSFLISAELDGFANTYSGFLTKSSNNIHSLKLTLKKANDFVGGIIEDRFGHAVIAAIVTSMDVNGEETTSDQDGRFTLNEVPGGQTNVRVSDGEATQDFGLTSNNLNNIVHILSPSDIQADYLEMKTYEDGNISSHGNGTSADSLLANAEIQSEDQHKKILLVFGSTWCGGCYRLNKFLNNPSVNSLLGKYFVVLELDAFEHDKPEFENPGASSLYDKYGNDGTIPMWFILDSQGKKLSDSLINGNNVSLNCEPIPLNHFVDMVKAAAPEITVQQLDELTNLIKHMNDD